MRRTTPQQRCEKRDLSWQQIDRLISPTLLLGTPNPATSCSRGWQPETCTVQSVPEPTSTRSPSQSPGPPTGNHDPRQPNNRVLKKIKKRLSIGLAVHHITNIRGIVCQRSGMQRGARMGWPEMARDGHSSPTYCICATLLHTPRPHLQHRLTQISEQRTFLPPGKAVIESSHPGGTVFA